MLSKTPLDRRSQKILVRTLVKNNRTKMLPKTHVILRYQKNCIDMLVKMVPHKSVAENTARTSTPRKDKIGVLIGKVVSKSDAQNTFEKSVSENDDIERLVNNKFDNESQNTVKKLHSKNDSI